MTDENFWFVTTPYVDAYEMAPYGDHVPITMDEFITKMRSQAMRWGDQGLGSALMRGQEVPRYNTRLVMAIGIFKDVKYAVTINPPIDWTLEDAQFQNQWELNIFEWPNSWDVT